MSGHVNRVCRIYASVEIEINVVLICRLYRFRDSRRRLFGTLKIFESLILKSTIQTHSRVRTPRFYSSTQPTESLNAIYKIVCVYIYTDLVGDIAIFAFNFVLVLVNGGGGGHGGYDNCYTRQGALDRIYENVLSSKTLDISIFEKNNNTVTIVRFPPAFQEHGSDPDATNFKTFRSRII